MKESQLQVICMQLFGSLSSVLLLLLSLHAGVAPLVLWHNRVRDLLVSLWWLSLNTIFGVVIRVSAFITYCFGIACFFNVSIIRGLLYLWKVVSPIVMVAPIVVPVIAVVVEFASSDIVTPVVVSSSSIASGIVITAIASEGSVLVVVIVFLTVVVLGNECVDSIREVRLLLFQFVLLLCQLS